MCLPCFRMASPLLLVDHGAAATAVQKKACRAAAVYPAFAATITTGAAAASAVLLLLLLCCCCAVAELLLCCCCGHVRVPPLRATKKICCASRFQPIFPFFDTRFVFFCDLTEFRRFAHRKHIQSDAGMNLAFFKFDRITG